MRLCRPWTDRGARRAAGRMRRAPPGRSGRAGPDFDASYVERIQKKVTSKEDILRNLGEPVSRSHHRGYRGLGLPPRAAGRRGHRDEGSEEEEPYDHLHGRPGAGPDVLELAPRASGTGAPPIPAVQATGPRSLCQWCPSADSTSWCVRMDGIIGSSSMRPPAASRGRTEVYCQPWTAELGLRAPGCGTVSRRRPAPGCPGGSAVAAGCRRPRSTR